MNKYIVIMDYCSNTVIINAITPTAQEFIENEDMYHYFESVGLNEDECAYMLLDNLNFEFNI